jgi:hypothetical protein
VVCATPDFLADAHFMSQTRILFGPDGRKRLDFIGKLENLEHDLGVISNRAQLGTITRTNSTSASHEWRNLYTLELASMIHNRFESDFNLFSYEDEYQNLLDHLQGSPE